MQAGRQLYNLFYSAVVRDETNVTAPCDYAENLEKIMRENKNHAYKYVLYIDIRIYTCYNIVMIRKGDIKMPLTPKEMIKLLKKNGFEEITQNGSHVKMRNLKNGKTVIVPYHSKAMKKGLEQAILKQAGLK